MDVQTGESEEENQKRCSYVVLCICVANALRGI